VDAVAASQPSRQRLALERVSLELTTGALQLVRLDELVLGVLDDFETEEKLSQSRPPCRSLVQLAEDLFDGHGLPRVTDALDHPVVGDDYFDLADDVIFEYVISVPGYPRRVQGRQSIIDLYSGYDDYMRVHSADNLRIYRDPEASVVVLEYEVHGESVQTGRPYNNRFVSIITVKDTKVVHWRDYLDPIAVLEATGWPDTLT
jgi:uncharacterized protein